MRICEKCGDSYSERPALSRRDNKTEICPTCGITEALEDLTESMLHQIHEDMSEAKVNKAQE